MNSFSIQKNRNLFMRQFFSMQQQRRRKHKVKENEIKYKKP